MKLSKSELFKRVETLIEIKSFINTLQYVIKSQNVNIRFIEDREIDKNRCERNTNKYTIATLFPNEENQGVLKRELLCLTYRDYIETVRDKRFKNLSEMRVFCKKYLNEYVYIKFRVALLSNSIEGERDYIMVMSFHFAEYPISENDFPFRQ